MSIKCIIGISATNQGAVSVIPLDNRLDPSVHELPTITTDCGKIYDMAEVNNIFKIPLSAYQPHEVIVTMAERDYEGITYRRKLFASGLNYGMLLGLSIALGYRIEIVTESVWQSIYVLETDDITELAEQLAKETDKAKHRKLGNNLTKLKNYELRDNAEMLYPSLTDSLSARRDKTHISEAVLIAHWYRHTVVEGKSGMIF